VHSSFVLQSTWVDCCSDRSSTMHLSNTKENKL
jgi:hypothetical protein